MPRPPKTPAAPKRPAAKRPAAKRPAAKKRARPAAAELDVDEILTEEPEEEGPAEMPDLSSAPAAITALAGWIGEAATGRRRTDETYKLSIAIRNLVHCMVSTGNTTPHEDVTIHYDFQL